MAQGIGIKGSIGAGCGGSTISGVGAGVFIRGSFGIISCGFSFGNGCSDGESEVSLFGGTKRRTIPIKAVVSGDLS